MKSAITGLLMVQLVEKIDKALESKQPCTLIHKMGMYYHGTLTESWVRLSGGKMRGKIRFASQERGEVEVDANDILDLILGGDKAPASKI